MKEVADFFDYAYIFSWCDSSTLDIGFWPQYDKNDISNTALW